MASSEHGNVPSGSTKSEILIQLQYYRLLSKDLTYVGKKQIIFLFDSTYTMHYSYKYLQKSTNACTTTKIIRNVNSYVFQRRGAIFGESKVQTRASNNSKLLEFQ